MHSREQTDNYCSFAGLVCYALLMRAVVFRGLLRTFEGGLLSCGAVLEFDRGGYPGITL